eukprot:g3385.t1
MTNDTIPPAVHQDEFALLYKNILAAGSCVGLAVAVFNPLDCLRIRWQVTRKGAFSSPYALASNIIAREGLITGLWRPGIVSNVLAAACARGIGMGTYPIVRDMLVHTTTDESGNTIPSSSSSSVMFLAGSLCGAFGYFVCTPFWKLKTVLQADRSSRAFLSRGKLKYGTNGFTALATVYRTSGNSSPLGLLHALYQGSTMLVIRGALMNAGNTLGYDLTKTKLHRENDLLDDNMFLHLIGSVVSAFLSSTFSTPADYILTRYQSASPGTYFSVVDCTQKLYQRQGAFSFFRGWTPMFVRVAPLYIFYLPLYEQLRNHLGLGYFR